MALLLSACGGGGGGGSDREPDTAQANFAPIARITASTTDGFASLTVNFNGAGSTDTDGSIAGYAWDFDDDGAVATGSSVSHTFLEPGGYNVRLTVTDDDGATGTVLQNIRVRGTRLSGTVQILGTSAVDSDVNDRLTTPFPNDDPLTAQPIANPVRLGGFVNLPGSGQETGNFFRDGDPADYYAVYLTGNELIVLNIGDATADLDLHLRDAAGNLVDASLSTQSTESIEAPAPGNYFIEVFPATAGTNISGGSNYVLSVGQDLSAGLRAPSRLTDPFVPGELLIASGPDDRRKMLAYDLAERGRAGRFARAAIGNDTLSELKQRLNLRTAADLPPGLQPDAELKYRTLLAAKRLAQDPEMDRIELNVLMQPNLTPDDPLYGLQWHLPDIRLPEAWDITTGTPTGPNDIIVAVVDTGILLDHPDFAGQLVDGYDFITDPDRARDFNGIDDNPADEGDFAYGASSSFHGTHVAGTVAARTDNGEGVAGVSWGAKIMPMRALGLNGGSNYDVLQAARYAAGLANDSGRLPNQPADIINLSLGSPFFSQATQDTFSEIRNSGVIVVASAGNESSGTPNYPAAYTGVVSVSATTINGGLAPYSNFGSVDVAAPGGFNGTDANGDGFGDGVVSTLGDDSNPGATQLGYGALSGTSMAAPHVAGIAALMKAVHPNLTPAQFDAALAAGDLTDDLGAAGRDDLYGFGLINAQKAVLTALSLAGGIGADPGPILATSLSTINLGVLAGSQVVRLSNLGTGSIELQPGNITSSETWLSVLPAAVDGNGLGDYELRVDRANLTEGAYNAVATFTPTDPATNAVTITVTLQVPGANPLADAGLFYVIAVREDGSSQGSAAVVAASNGEYSWVLTDMPAGSYRIFAGSDMDDDNFLCDAGESCGAFRTLDEAERIAVDPASTPEITGVDFVSEFRAVITTQANNADAGGLDTGPQAGFAFSRPPPRQAPPPESAAEQR
jgi:serine protease